MCKHFDLWHACGHCYTDQLFCSHTTIGYGYKPEGGCPDTKYESGDADYRCLDCTQTLGLLPDVSSPFAPEGSDQYCLPVLAPFRLLDEYSPFSIHKEVFPEVTNRVYATSPTPNPKSRAATPPKPSSKEFFKDYTFGRNRRVAKAAAEKLGRREGARLSRKDKASKDLLAMVKKEPTATPPQVSLITPFVPKHNPSFQPPSYPWSVRQSSTLNPTAIAWNQPATDTEPTSISGYHESRMVIPHPVPQWVPQLPTIAEQSAYSPYGPPTDPFEQHGYDQTPPQLSYDQNALWENLAAYGEQDLAQLHQTQYGQFNGGQNFHSHHGTGYGSVLHPGLRQATPPRANHGQSYASQASPSYFQTAQYHNGQPNLAQASPHHLSSNQSSPYYSQGPQHNYGQSYYDQASPNHLNPYQAALYYSPVPPRNYGQHNLDQDSPHRYGPSRATPSYSQVAQQSYMQSSLGQISPNRFGFSQDNSNQPLYGRSLLDLLRPTPRVRLPGAHPRPAN